jgi:hypothetical protein
VTIRMCPRCVPRFEHGAEALHARVRSPGAPIPACTVHGRHADAPARRSSPEHVARRQAVQVAAVRGRSAVRWHPAMSGICRGNSLGRQPTRPPNAPLMWAVSGLSGAIRTACSGRTRQNAHAEVRPAFVDDSGGSVRRRAPAPRLTMDRMLLWTGCRSLYGQRGSARQCCSFVEGALAPIAASRPSACSPTVSTAASRSCAWSP